jgi:hypothetical protein
MTPVEWEKYFLAEAKDYFNEMNSCIEWVSNPSLITFWERKMYYALFQWAGYRE